MSRKSTVSVELRDRAGKGAARAVRRAGRVPAVIYGDKKEPTLVSLDPRDLIRELHASGFYTRLFELDMGGKKEVALARDVQLDPVSDFPLHVDFMRVGADSTIHVNVPVHFSNQEKSPGIKKGGLLNIVQHEIELICKADAIPDALEVDLLAFDINSSIHISQIKIPAGARLAQGDRDFTVATIVPPSGAGDKGEAA